MGKLEDSIVQDLRRHGPSTHREIRQRLGLTKAHMLRALRAMTRGGAIRLAQLSAPRKWEALDQVVAPEGPPTNPPRKAADETIRRRTVLQLDVGGIAGLPSDWLPASKADHLSDALSADLRSLLVFHRSRGGRR